MVWSQRNYRVALDGMIEGQQRLYYSSHRITQIANPDFFQKEPGRRLRDDLVGCDLKAGQPGASEGRGDGAIGCVAAGCH
jgi:hypothetical protein